MADYKKKTFTEFVELGEELGKTFFEDSSWSGFQPGSLDLTNLQIVAELAALIQANQDLRALQGYIPTATIRRDVRRMCQNIGLFPQELAGATVTCQFTSTNSTPATVPLGTIVSTATGIRFVTTAEVILDSGNAYTASVECVNASYIRRAARASGAINETMDLGNQADTIPDQLQVRVNGELYTRVQTLADTDETSKIYQVRYRDNESVYIQFGDGQNGARLPADAQIYVDVFSGGGPSGNGVAIGSITTVSEAFTNSDNVTVTNTTESSGGKAADSVPKMIADIAGSVRQVSGLVNAEDTPKVLRRELPWLADAKVNRTFDLSGSLTIPTATVVAFPYNDAIGDMSPSQQQELAEFVARRGELGVQWNTTNALDAPIEIELSVKLDNNALKDQKSAEIRNALVALSGTQPFAFNNLGFDKEYTRQSVVDTVEAIEGVRYCDVSKFARKPYVLQTNGSTDYTDHYTSIELGDPDDTVDGYLELSASGVNTQSASFYRPFVPGAVTATSVTDDSQNYLVTQFTMSALVDDVNGPFIMVSGSRLAIRQNELVWTANGFSGSTWPGKHIVRVQYNEGALPRDYYYHVQSNTYNQILTRESGSAPLNGGAGIVGTLSGTQANNITVSVYKDNSAGVFITPSGQTMNVLYNNGNTVFLSSSQVLQKVPVKETSFIRFNETTVSLASGFLISNGGIVKCFLSSGIPADGSRFAIYTTNSNSPKLSFKHPREVFSLKGDDVKIRFL